MQKLRWISNEFEFQDAGTGFLEHEEGVEDPGSVDGGLKENFVFGFSNQGDGPVDHVK